MDKKKIIELMNQAITLEYQAFIQYFYQSLMLKGFSTMAMAQMLKTEADIELGHAKMLADKVVSMGGLPSTSVAPVILTEKPVDMIKANIEREKKAITIYEELLSLVGEDQSLYMMVQQILTDEINDLDEFDRMLE